jgi:hypothetical protein
VTPEIKVLLLGVVVNAKERKGFFARVAAVEHKRKSSAETWLRLNDVPEMLENRQAVFNPRVGSAADRRLHMTW